ncbi:MAG TPA: serine/threonine-protein kinase [Candidatus Melainabacteria bacterium]|nr:serine/threonine-protein kinase [Candidatus Melainabacteria bacterium]
MENSKKCINCNQQYGTELEKCETCKLPLTPISNDFARGEVIGEKYAIEALIGDGGMSKVYRASHKLMKRKVAIKMLHAGLVGQTATLTRFKKEAEASSRLSHTNIVTTFDFGLTPDGRPYLVMDYLEGKTFTDLLNEARLLDPGRCLKLFIQLCAGLEHAHARGIVHRDIKPSNIFVVEDEKGNEVIKLLDFGIAKRVSRDREESDEKEDCESKNEPTLTEAGTVFGSPLYMSPEQVRGEKVDFRSDVYSLSCLLYQSLTGTPIYDADDAMDCMYHHVNDDPEPFNHRCPTADIPEGLQELVFKGLAKSPENRIQSMEEYRELLEEELKKLEQPEIVPELNSASSERPEAQPTELDEAGQEKSESIVKSIDPLSYLIPLAVVLLLSLITQFTDTRLFNPEVEAKKAAVSRNNEKPERQDKQQKREAKAERKNSEDDSRKDKRGPLQIPQSKEAAERPESERLLEEGKTAFRNGDFEKAQNRFVEALENSKKEGTEKESLQYLESAFWVGKTLMKRKQYRLAAGYLEWSAEKFETRYGTGSRFAKEARADLALCKQALALKPKE